ncbi:MAG: type I glyceraldehyde-3-phosphate dehydrogenase [Candidatus Hydrogenedentota bacterium]
MTNVAINGLGRIGRATLRILVDRPDLKLVAVNDIVPLKNLVYLLRYDTVFGRFPKTIQQQGDSTLVIDGQEIRFLQEKNPAELPWEEMGVQLVFECSGAFTHREELEKHLNAGARHVILSAPIKGDGVPTVVHGVNNIDASEPLRSCASCTTNCITPVAEIMKRRVGVKKALMTTIHAYTSTQDIVDGPSKKLRRGRAAAQNLVPTTTGAAKATGKALPEYEGYFDGVAVRAPVPVGSISDLTFVTERKTSAEEVNNIFREEAGTERYEGILGVSDDEIVSSDIIMDPRASVVDLTMTQVVDGDLVKVMSWYDNEWGYSMQMVKEAESIVKHLADPSA